MPFVARLVIAAPAALRHENLCIIRASYSFIMGLVNSNRTLIQQPEDFIYGCLYSPVSVRELLDSADGRGRIRQMPVAHLFFAAKDLESGEVARLLPHITEEQWTAILDLDVWSRDNVRPGAFVSWQKYIIAAQDAVARKLIRAADQELWELIFKREVQVHEKSEEDEYQGEAEQGEWLLTPDDYFLIILPPDSERARLLRDLILRLYELEPEYAARLISSAGARTSQEIEEVGYQNRKRRVEGLGFQDYFEALEIYTYLPSEEPFPEKRSETIHPVSTLPAKLPQAEEQSLLLLFKALALVTPPQEAQILLEELVFVGNKILSADQVSVADPARVKQGIRKAIMGINLGLDWWSSGDSSKAVEGLQAHYLQTFFQAGYSRLEELRKEALILSKNRSQELGSFEEAFLEGLLEGYPLLVENQDGQIQKRLFSTLQDLERAREKLRQLSL